MDLLRLYLPGLHQALRGALESLSTFVSYLMGDEVPTVERGARAAEELGEGVEEEAQEALEGLEGGPDGHEEASRCQEGNSAETQTRGWGEGGSQTDKQTMGAWEAVQVARCQELSAPSGDVPSGIGQGAHWDSSSQVQQRQEPGGQEVDREDTLRTWDQEEGEEEKIRTGEAGMARGVEQEWTWHGTPEGQVGASGSRQEGTGGGGQTGQEVKEAVAEETEEPVANKAGREEEGVVVGRGGADTGSQGSGAEPGHWEALGREQGGTVSGWEEACTTSANEVKEERKEEVREEEKVRKEEAWTGPSREQTEQPRVREPENGPVLGEGTPEGPGSSWVLEEEEEERKEEEEEKVRKEEAWTAPSREQTEQPRVREPENGPVLGEGTPEGPGSSWVLEEEEEERKEEEEEKVRKEEAWTAPSREQTEQPRVREPENGPVLGEGTPEGPGSSWVLEEEEEERKEEEEEKVRKEEAWTAPSREQTEQPRVREPENGPVLGEGTPEGPGSSWVLEEEEEERKEEEEEKVRKEEAWTAPSREQTEQPRVREPENGPVLGEGTPEGPGSSWVLEEEEEERKEEEEEKVRKEEAWTAPSREQTEQPRVREPENGPVLGEGTPEGPGSSWVLEEEEEERKEEEEEKVRKEEAWTAPSREQTEQPRVREPENGPVLGEGTPEGPGSSWVLEEEEEWETREKRAAALSLFPKLTQALEAESPMAGAQAAEEEEEEAAGQGSAYHAGQPENESAPERQDVEMSAGGVGVQEAAEMEEAQREGDADVEAAPEPRPWEVLVRERREEAHLVSRAALGEEDQGPALTGGAQTPAAPLEEEELELGTQEEPRRTTAPSTEGTEGDLDECSRPEVREADAWENQRRDPWEAEGGDADRQESTTSAQVLEWEAKSAEGREWKKLEVPGADGDWEKAKIAGCGAGQGEAHRVEDQEVAGNPEAEAGMGWSLGEAREAGEGESARLQQEAEGASGPGWRPQEEVAQSLQEGLEARWAEDEAGGPGRGAGLAWQGRGEVVEAEAPGRLEWGLQGSAEEELTCQEEHTEALGARTDEQAEVGTLAEATVGLGSHGLGSQAARAEGTRETLGDEWRLLEPEAGERQDKEGLCRVNHPDSEAPGVQASGEQRAEAQDTDTSSVMANQGQAEPSGDQSSWSEALLPALHLDVSVPRSRALLARSSSQRRSRPSFRRPRDTQEQVEPSSPSSPQQPKEEEEEEEEEEEKKELSTLAEERRLQSEEPPEPSPPGPVGTPVPARRPLGQGFGLAHPGMMQELQARLGRPKPQ
ncbi:apolipoprotein B receptor [Ochotona curzoniae]|uniref:apolipoprotein B receptor n=1 Tax=Ochotona curzoniae TaxID=130825 RepID=UPI001B34695B|nr:apolipoprotein B receptor [Ochotona curzoniae]